MDKELKWTNVRPLGYPLPQTTLDRIMNPMREAPRTLGPVDITTELTPDMAAARMTVTLEFTDRASARAVGRAMEEAWEHVVAMKFGRPQPELVG